MLQGDVSVIVSWHWADVDGFVKLCEVSTGC